MKYNCWECGKEMDYDGIVNIRRNFCDKCRKKHEDKIKNKKEKYKLLKQKLMLERALKTMENIEKVDNFKDYRVPYLILKDYIQKNNNKFDSQYEVIAALELLKSNIKFTPQFKIKGYKCDFKLDNKNTILEVDGYYHKNRNKKDNKRDGIIKNSLGGDWEIVRIPTKYLKENPKQLVKAIIKLRNKNKSNYVRI